MYSSELYQRVIIRYKNQSELDRKTVAKRRKRNPRARLNLSPQPFSPFPCSLQTFRLGRYDILQCTVAMKNLAVCGGMAVLTPTDPLDFCSLLCNFEKGIFSEILKFEL